MGTEAFRIGSVLLLVFAAFSVLNYWISAKGKPLVAQISFMIAGPSLLLFLVLAFVGPGPGLHTYFIMFALLPVLILPGRLWWLTALLCVAFVLLYIYLQYFYTLPAPLEFSAELMFELRLMSTIGAFLSLLLILGFTQREASRYERRFEKLNETKDRFFHLIAHDLKNPLGSMMNLTHLATDKEDLPASEELEEYLGTMKSLSHNLYELLEGLLLWASDQEGDIPFEPESL